LVSFSYCGPPHVLKELTLRNELLGVPCEHFDDLPFGGCEARLSVGLVTRSAVRSMVKSAVSTTASSSPGGCSSEGGTQSSKQLVHAERLRHVVVGNAG
jgi:hypothetical protein